MSENNDYIQLPPLKKDTPADVVAFMWEYMKVPEEDVYKRQVHTPLFLEVFLQKYAKVSRHTSQNPIVAGNLE